MPATLTLTIAPPGAAPDKDVGKYVEVRRKQADGRWLIVAEISNSDAPVPRPAPKK